MEGSSLVMVDGYPWVGGTSPEGSVHPWRVATYSLYSILPMSTILPTPYVCTTVPYYCTTSLDYHPTSTILPTPLDTITMYVGTLPTSHD